MKKEKVGLTTTNYILCIGGILLLSLIIILPPVFRIVFKSNDNQINQDEIVNHPELSITCYKDNIKTDTTTNNETYIFNYKDNKVKSYTKIINKNFLDPNNYETEKYELGRLVTAFSVINGYNYSINPNDDQLLLIVNEKYDLETFNSTIISIPGNTEPTSLSAEYSLDQSILEIQNQLTNDGYLCSQNG